MTVKDFKTYDEQIDLLASRGISLSTSDQRGRAKKILQHEGYYNLINGYKKMFLVPPSEDARQDYVETYKTGTTIDEIHALYLFDQKLREAIFPFVLKIETNIKSLIAYYFPKEHGYANYGVDLEHFGEKIPEPSDKSSIAVTPGEILDEAGVDFEYYRRYRDMERAKEMFEALKGTK